MDCSVTLIQDGISTTKLLIPAWGNKFALSFKHDFGQGQQRIRVVLEVKFKERGVNGFVQIGQEKTGLPPHRLTRNTKGFSAVWPSARGLIVEVNVSGEETQQKRIA